MKKTGKTLIASFMVLVCLLGTLVLSACGGTSYHFVSAKIESIESAGEVHEYEIGDELPNGLIARKDLLTVQLKPDGVVVMTIKVGFFSEEKTGTWEASEDDPNQLFLDIEGAELFCIVDGSKLVIGDTDETAVITFER